MSKAQQRSLAELRASLAAERDLAIASVKKAIRAAELSDNLNADLEATLVSSLKKALAKLEELNPDAPFDAGALDMLAQPIVSMFQGLSITQRRS